MKKQLLIVLLVVSSFAFGKKIEDLTEKQQLLQQIITEQEEYIAQGKRDLKTAQDKHLRPEVIAVQHDVIVMLEKSLADLRALQQRNFKKIGTLTMSIPNK